MQIYTKESLIEQLREIKQRGWIASNRPGNAGAVGNVLEDLLGVQENNLPIANAAEWELKARRKTTNSLTTLFHCEPSPQAVGFVSNLLLPMYGWPHKQAGKRYPANEKSFRQTINALARTNRGFGVIVNWKDQKVEISFDANSVSADHKRWLRGVGEKIGLGELNPQPYWGFDDLFHNAGTKLKNMFYVTADRKLEKGVEYFYYESVKLLSTFDKDKFIQAIESGDLLIDFDARTGHNHGTKFRLRQGKLPELYASVETIF